MRTVFVDPGMLRTRLDLEEPVETADGQGGAIETFALVAGVWGQIEPVSARSQELAASLEQRLTHRITVRHRNDVKPAMRFSRLGRSFLIKTVSDPDGSGRYLVCQCEEIAP